MEFEEIKKIWDTQNKEHLFIINEKAFHKMITKKKNQAQLISNLNEIGLIFIAIITSLILITRNLENGNIYSFLPSVVLLLTGLYVFIGRIKRKNAEKKIANSILGQIDQAIANSQFEINRARTFVWWYILPLTVPLFLNMFMNDAPAWKWIVVPFSLVLSFFVVKWGLTKSQIPRLSNLISLRKKLLEEVAESNVVSE